MDDLMDGLMDGLKNKVKLYGIYYKDQRNVEHRYDGLPHGHGYGEGVADLLCKMLKRAGVDAYPKCVVTIDA